MPTKIWGTSEGRGFRWQQLWAPEKTSLELDRIPGNIIGSPGNCDKKIGVYWAPFLRAGVRLPVPVRSDLVHGNLRAGHHAHSGARHGPHPLWQGGKWNRDQKWSGAMGGGWSDFSQYFQFIYSTKVLYVIRKESLGKSWSCYTLPPTLRYKEWQGNWIKVQAFRFLSGRDIHLIAWEFVFSKYEYGLQNLSLIIPI